MTGYIKNNRNVVINTDNDKLIEYKKQKHQILRDRDFEKTITQLKSEISLIKEELLEIKAIIDSKGT